MQNRSSSRWRWGEQIQARADTRRGQGRGHHRGRRALPLGPGDVDHAEPEVGIAQPPEEPAHPAEAELGRGPGHAHRLVIQPAVEVVEAVLVIVGHGDVSGSTPPGGDRRTREPFGSGSRSLPRAATTELNRRIRRRGGGQVQQRVDPGTQLGEREVLGPVVGHAQGEALQPGVGIALVREDDHLQADGLPGFAQMFQDFQAVEDRHPDVQEQQVGPVGPDAGHRLGPVGGLPHPMTRAAEPLGIECPQVGVIFGQHDGRFHVMPSHDRTLPSSNPSAVKSPGP